MKTFEGNNGLTYLWEEGSDTIEEVESTMISVSYTHLTLPTKRIV